MGFLQLARGWQFVVCMLIKKAKNVIKFHIFGMINEEGSNLGGLRLLQLLPFC